MKLNYQLSVGISSWCNLSLFCIIITFVSLTDEPQDRCVQCGNCYLATRHQTIRGLCRDCTSGGGGPLHSSPEGGRDRHPKPFTIESLVSPERNARQQELKSGPKTSPQGTPVDLKKAPYYASAMMSAGVLPMHYGNGGGHYGMGVGWPPTPLGRYGI